MVKWPKFKTILQAYLAGSAASVMAALLLMGFRDALVTALILFCGFLMIVLIALIMWAIDP